MVDKSRKKPIISVGFLSPGSSIKSMVSNYDIVCDDNDSYEDVGKILFKDFNEKKQ